MGCLIHGLKKWNKGDRLWLPSGTVCCSWHEEGSTVPLRPMGLVLEAPGGIQAAFAYDVASFLNGVVRERSLAHARAEDFGEDWDRLLAATRIGGHNEVWVDGGKADVVDFYQHGSSPGSKLFRRDCLAAGLPEIF